MGAIEAAQWGTVGEWFSGVGGLLAVGVAAYFGLREYRLRVKADEQKERGEAGKLVVRLVNKTRGEEHKVRVSNYSTAPFRRIELTAQWEDETLRATWAHDKQAQYWLDPMPEDKTDDVIVSAVNAEGVTVSSDPPKIFADYSDSSGRRWRTDEVGSVTPGQTIEQQPGDVREPAGRAKRLYQGSLIQVRRVSARVGRQPRADSVPQAAADVSGGRWRSLRRSAANRRRMPPSK